MGQDCDAFAPNPDGTFLSEGRDRWGPFDKERVTFEGDPAVLSQLFAKNEVDIVASGFRWTEGPTWVEQRNALYFSDTVDARIYKYSHDDRKVVPVVELSGGYDGENVENYDKLFEPGSNGMTLAGEDIYICQHPTHRVVRAKLSDLAPGAPFCESRFDVLADSVSPDGPRLNSPNDVILGPDGAVWFTDPVYGFLEKDPLDPFVPVQPTDAPAAGNYNPADLPYLDDRCRAAAGKTGVYRWSEGKLALVVGELDRPNGLAFHEKTLWVANSSAKGPSWVAYDASAIIDGAVEEIRPLRQVARLSPVELGPMQGPGLSDGFRIDELGRMWSSCPNGLAVIDLGRRALLAKVNFNTNISNVEFGRGPDVWVTGLGHLWRLQRAVPERGAERPQPAS